MGKKENSSSNSKILPRKMSGRRPSFDASYDGKSMDINEFYDVKSIWAAKICQAGFRGFVARKRIKKIRTDIEALTSPAHALAKTRPRKMRIPKGPTSFLDAASRQSASRKAQK